ncbi:MAG: DUF6285 domain-containing protein [Labedaea sp.]
MLDERPTAAELVDAVAEFLTQRLLPTLDGQLAFHTRVAANALRIVHRELTCGAKVAEAELARLRALAGADRVDDADLNSALAERIRTGDLSTSDESLRDHLIRSVLARMAIDNPGYPSLAEAATRWPDQAQGEAALP